MVLYMVVVNGLVFVIKFFVFNDFDFDVNQCDWWDNIVFYYVVEFFSVCGFVDI